MICSWIEISKEAFNHNVKALKAIIGDVNLGIVIKSNGYGHGLEIMAMLAQENDSVAIVFVATAQEALRVRKAGFTKPLCVIAYYDAPFDQLIIHDIDLVCYDQQTLTLIVQAAVSVNRIARIHGKIDTGMNRLGMAPDELDFFIEAIQNNHYLSLVGLMSHCADSSFPDSHFTRKQVALFDTLVSRVKDKIPTLVWVHCCSSGSFLLSKNHTVVRIGTNIYGAWKSSAQKNMLQALFPNFFLRQLLTWKAKIIALKSIARGSLVGYSCTFIADRDMRIAIVPVGYADGYPRELSNRGFVVINTIRAPVVGIVSMGLLIVDVTDISGVDLYSEVVLVSDAAGICIDDCAQISGRFNLDLLTRLNPDCARYIV